MCSGTALELLYILFNEHRMKEDYGEDEYNTWLHSVLYRLNADGTRHVCGFGDYPVDSVDRLPPSWPAAASQDSDYASETSYRARHREWFPLRFSELTLTSFT